MKRSWWWIGVLVLLPALLLGACRVTGTPDPETGPILTVTGPVLTATPLPTPSATVSPTAGIPLDAGLIGGRVWHDVCSIAGGEGGAPAQPSAGCVPEDGGYRANGIPETGEPGLEGVLVTLGAGVCPSTRLAAAITGSDGTYVFNDLYAGTYCVTIDPLAEPNASLLLPGGWTAPARDQGSMEVTLNPGMQRLDVDFGWDYQFLPADETAAFSAWLRETLATRQDEAMAALMNDPFVIAGWRSEGRSLPPDQAVAELQANHFGPGTRLTYPERDVTTLLGGADPYAIFGPEAPIAAIVFAGGWGPQGQDEALLYISRDPAGGYKWYGVLTAFGGFGQTAALLAWERQGGIAGFCDELVVYGAGDAHARTCANEDNRALGVGLLSGERLATLRRWVSEFQPFTFEHTDPATADAMTIGLTLYGAGQAEAGEAEVQAMQDFAAQLFAELGSVQETNIRYVLAQADLSIQSGPGVDYASVGQAASGQAVRVTGQSLDGGWWRVLCPGDMVGSCWVPADPRHTLPTAPPADAGPQDGLLATFDVSGELFRVWVTDPADVEQILALQDGASGANIPNGRILRGPGPGGYNLPWNWHLDPADIEMAEMTTEVCDGRPSYVQGHVDEFVDVVGRYCPWNAALVEVTDLRDAGTACAAPPAGAARLANEGHGYCLHYPDDFTVENPLETEVVLLGPVPGAGDRARAFIEVEDAAGRTTAQAADALLAGLPDFDVVRGQIGLGGEPAVLLDRVPGQDLSRQIITVHGGRLYRLTFVPSDPEFDEPYRDMERVYAAVLNSFRFMP